MATVSEGTYPNPLVIILQSLFLSEGTAGSIGYTMNGTAGFWGNSMKLTSGRQPENSPI